MRLIRLFLCLLNKRTHPQDCRGYEGDVVGSVFNIAPLV
jgi:hypothetical protein